jgi:DNA-binding response OmpR family regulator
MPLILVAADADWVHDEVRAALVGPGYEVVAVWDGMAVTPTVVRLRPDLCLVDMQIGNMGGFAVAKDLRLEESADRAPHVPILLLLDRSADVFLARRAAVEAWLVKPVDPGTLRRTVRKLLADSESTSESTSADAAATDSGSAGSAADAVAQPIP